MAEEVALVHAEAQVAVPALGAVEAVAVSTVASSNRIPSCIRMSP